MKRIQQSAAVLTAAWILSTALPAAEGRWTVTVFHAKEGYRLESASHQRALDLIDDVPWLNPASSKLESPIFDTVAGNFETLNFHDPDSPGLGGRFDGTEPFPGGRAGIDDDHFALLAEGKVRIAAAGSYTFICGRDDTFELTVDGKTADDNGRGASGVCCETSRPGFTFDLPAGDLPIRLTYGESQSGAFLELLAAPGADVPFEEPGPFRLVGDKAAGGLEVISAAPCDDPPEAAVIAGAPAAKVAVGSRVPLDGSASTAGGAGRVLTYHWEVASGPGTIVEADDRPTVTVLGSGAGAVTVRLTVDDGVCENGATAEASIHFAVDAGPPGVWQVTHYRAKPGFKLAADSHGPAVDLISDIPWFNDGSGQFESPILSKTEGVSRTINFVDPDAPGDGGVLDPSQPFPGDRENHDDDHFAIRATATIQNETAGYYSFIAGHADTFSLTIDGQSVDFNGSEATGVCCDEIRPILTFYLPEGLLPVEITFGASEGGAYLELLAATGINVPFRDDFPYRLVGDTENGGLALAPSPIAIGWVRGDANGDTVIDISDPVASLQYQFLAGVAPECPPALDTNEDGIVDLTDPVHDLNVLFLGAAKPLLWGRCDRNALLCPARCPPEGP